jgi:hypothetical protein
MGKKRNQSVFTSFDVTGRKRKKRDKFFGGSLNLFSGSKGRKRAGRAGRAGIGGLIEMLMPTRRLHLSDPNNPIVEEQLHDPEENSWMHRFNKFLGRR